MNLVCFSSEMFVVDQEADRGLISTTKCRVIHALVHVHTAGAVHHPTARCLHDGGI